MPERVDFPGPYAQFAGPYFVSPSSLFSQRFQRPPVLGAQRRPLQQLRPVSQRLLQLLFAPPAPDLGVIAIHQDLRGLKSAKLRRPRVMRIVQQSSRPMLRPRNPLHIHVDLRVRRRQSFQIRSKPRCPARPESAAWSRPPPPPPPARLRSAHSPRSKAPCRSRVR